MVNYLIRPYTQTISYNISYFDVRVTDIRLKESAGITVNFYDTTNTVRRCEFFVLEGQDYVNWTNDDFLLNLICTKFNLVMLRV